MESGPVVCGRPHLPLLLLLQQLLPLLLLGAVNLCIKPVDPGPRAPPTSASGSAATTAAQVYTACAEGTLPAASVPRDGCGGRLAAVAADTARRPVGGKAELEGAPPLPSSLPLSPLRLAAALRCSRPRRLIRISRYMDAAIMEVPSESISTSTAGENERGSCSADASSAAPEPAGGGAAVGTARLGRGHPDGQVCCGRGRECGGGRGCGGGTCELVDCGGGGAATRGHQGGRCSSSSSRTLRASTATTVAASLSDTTVSRASISARDPSSAASRSASSAACCVRSPDSCGAEGRGRGAEGRGPAQEAEGGRARGSASRAASAASRAAAAAASSSAAPLRSAATSASSAAARASAVASAASATCRLRRWDSAARRGGEGPDAPSHSTSNKIRKAALLGASLRRLCGRKLAAHLLHCALPDSPLGLQVLLAVLGAGLYGGKGRRGVSIGSSRGQGSLLHGTIRDGRVGLGASSLDCSERSAASASACRPAAAASCSACAASSAASRDCSNSA
ncbi:hypothetical protein TSOC_002847 [Tetrabaena socialis]|uniref:Uncharacterized protein n=1 Tax=Tetrabaena socialis TaxID=47790 RepID=A0A2J8AD13_9CHLO|nr:hypothetical protein TSOC_002847 [Tetrabaena socialis]|eukprot:PNH10402.1 hypothetical protein TSOC_002847 [Tetrabaena socialis]